MSFKIRMTVRVQLVIVFLGRKVYGPVHLEVIWGKVLLFIFLYVCTWEERRTDNCIHSQSFTHLSEKQLNLQEKLYQENSTKENYQEQESFTLEVERECKFLWNSLLRSSTNPDRLLDHGAKREWGKVKGAMFTGSMALLRAGPWLRKGGRNICVILSLLY